MTVGETAAWVGLLAVGKQGSTAILKENPIGYADNVCLRQVFPETCDMQSLDNFPLIV